MHLLFVSAQSDSISLESNSKNASETVLDMDTMATGPKKVFIVDIKETIAPPVLRKIQKAFNQASENKADLILIHMNTYGGMVETADSIRTRILNSKIPVVVFIDNNAASAGALISIACDSIYMRTGANIGAATVVNQNAEKMPDKYQSYMRATMRSTAEAKGRDPLIAEAMVDESVYIPEISDTGKVLTFTASEAMKNGYCEGIGENIDEILKMYGYTEYETIRLELKATDHIIGFLINPFVSGILIMVIIGGIYFELQSPGVGFPLAAAAFAAILYFAPLYLEGLAANWEIVLFVLGVVLVMIEVFAIPGFGVAGISGIVLIVMGLALSMVDNVNFTFNAHSFNQLTKAFFVVIAAISLAIFGSIWLTKRLFTGRTFFGTLALDASQPSSEGFTIAAVDTKMKIGAQGVAQTILRPAGKVRIDDDIFDATAESGYIDKGEMVVVVKYETAQLIVKKMKN